MAEPYPVGCVRGMGSCLGVILLLVLAVLSVYGLYKFMSS